VSHKLYSRSHTVADSFGLLVLRKRVVVQTRLKTLQTQISQNGHAERRHYLDVGQECVVQLWIELGQGDVDQTVGEGVLEIARYYQTRLGQRYHFYQKIGTIVQHAQLSDSMVDVTVLTRCLHPSSNS
jgi:hypothetical protein